MADLTRVSGLMVTTQRLQAGLLLIALLLIQALLLRRMEVQLEPLIALLKATTAIGL